MRNPRRPRKSESRTTYALRVYRLNRDRLPTVSMETVWAIARATAKKELSREQAIAIFNAFIQKVTDHMTSKSPEEFVRKWREVILADASELAPAVDPALMPFILKLYETMGRGNWALTGAHFRIIEDDGTEAMYSMPNMPHLPRLFAEDEWELRPMKIHNPSYYFTRTQDQGQSLRHVA